MKSKIKIKRTFGVIFKKKGKRRLDKKKNFFATYVVEEFGC